MRYFLWLALYTYGILYQISSSEFWPITISKTWFTPEIFETSMLQKPLLTIFLASFHLLPLNDTIHIFFAKTVFAVFGVMGLTYFCHFILELTKFETKKLHKSDLAALMAFVLVCASPVIRNNFFNIRSDQVAFLFFSLFLYYCGRRQMWWALGSLVLIPCFGIKEIIFLIPGALYFFWSFRSLFNPKTLFFTILSAMTVLVWIVALNLNSVFYLLQTFESANYKTRFGVTGLQSEAALLLLSFGAAVFIFTKRISKFYQINWIALISIVLILTLPQANDFFFASMLPIAILPLIILLLKIKQKSVKSAVVVISLIWSAGYVHYYKLPWHTSNLDQLWFIEMASKVVSANQFTYLDGQGILPRQKFLPCFVSPDDDIANNSCRYQMAREKPDVLIITNRLFYLGEEVFRFAEAKYTQIYPNFWVINEKMNDNLRAKIDLSATKPLPVIIF